MENAAPPLTSTPSELLQALDAGLREEIASSALAVLEERLGRADLLRRQSLEIYAGLLERQTRSLTTLVEETEPERRQLAEEARTLRVALEAAQQENNALAARLDQSAAREAEATNRADELANRADELARRLLDAQERNQSLETQLADSRLQIDRRDAQIAAFLAWRQEAIAYNAQRERRLAQLQDQWERLQTSAPAAE